jgi:hypothetical protein
MEQIKKGKIKRKGKYDIQEERKCQNQLQIYKGYVNLNRQIFMKIRFL